MSTAMTSHGNSATGNSRRRHERTSTSGRVRGEVADAADPSLIGQSFTGDIVEVSPCGLRVETSLDILDGTLEMWAELDGYDRRIFLSTEIRWSECVDEDVFHIGVEIIANPLSDIDHWCDFQREQWFLHKSAESP